MSIVLLGRQPDEVIKVMSDSDEGVFFDVAADRTVKEVFRRGIFSSARYSMVIRLAKTWRKCIDGSYNRT